MLQCFIRTGGHGKYNGEHESKVALRGVAVVVKALRARRPARCPIVLQVVERERYVVSSPAREAVKEGR